MLATLTLRTARPALVRGFASTSRWAAEAAKAEAPKPKAAKGPKVVSALQAGTVMQGLGVFKDKPDPVALPEDQYPPWLWTLLDAKADAKPADGAERDFKADRRRLRAQNRTNIKAANYLKTT